MTILKYGDWVNADGYEDTIASETLAEIEQEVRHKLAEQFHRYGINIFVSLRQSAKEQGIDKEKIAIASDDVINILAGAEVLLRGESDV